jgi:Peptidase family M23/IPT/TIG domain
VFRFLKTLVIVLLASGCGGNDPATTSTPQPTTSTEASVTLTNSSGNNLTLKALDEKVSIGTDCYLRGTDFTTLAGKLFEKTASCGEFLGLTNTDASGAYSIGRYEYAHDLSSNITLRVTQQRVTGNAARPVEVYFLGGAFGLAFSGGRASYYIYESEAHWTGWLDTDLANVTAANSITVEQNGQSIIVSLNGNVLDRFTLKAPVTQKRVSIFFKGNPGIEESMRFSEFLVLDNDASKANTSQVDYSLLNDYSFVSSQGVQPNDQAVELGTAVDPISELPIRKITISNNSSAPLQGLGLVPNGVDGSVQLNFPHSASCNNITSLDPGKKCVLFVGSNVSETVARSEGSEKAVARTQSRVLLTTASGYKPLVLNQTLAAPVVKPIANTVDPSIGKIGQRIKFTVYGKNLPANLSLTLSGSTCENTSKPSNNAVFCTVGNLSTGRLEVLESIGGKRFGVFDVKIVTDPTYSAPLDSAYMSKTLSQDYGVKNSNFGNKYHTGFDIGTADKNPSVYAVADGTVHYTSIGDAKYKSAYDKYLNAFVIVKHDGFYAYYGHINSTLKKGDQVFKGSSIGSIRDAYYSTSKLYTANNHLHITVSKDFQTGGWGYQLTYEDVTTKYVNPRKYIGL